MLTKILTLLLFSLEMIGLCFGENIHTGFQVEYSKTCKDSIDSCSEEQLIELLKHDYDKDWELPTKNPGDIELFSSKERCAGISIDTITSTTLTGMLKTKSFVRFASFNNKRKLKQEKFYEHTYQLPFVANLERPYSKIHISNEKNNREITKEDFMAVPCLYPELLNDLHIGIFSSAICKDKWHCSISIGYSQREFEKEGNKTQIKIFNIGDKKYIFYIPNESPLIKIIPPQYNQIPAQCFTPIEVQINPKNDIKKYETNFVLINEEDNEQCVVDVRIEITPDQK